MTECGWQGVKGTSPLRFAGETDLKRNCVNFCCFRHDLSDAFLLLFLFVCFFFFVCLFVCLFFVSSAG